LRYNVWRVFTFLQLLKTGFSHTASRNFAFFARLREKTPVAVSGSRHAVFAGHGHFRNRPRFSAGYRPDALRETPIPG